jgi:hypothetical protein
MRNVTSERACNSEIMIMIIIINKVVVYSVWPGKRERELGGGGVRRNSWD